MVPNEWNSGIYKRMYQSHEALGHTEEALKYARLYFDMQQAIEKQPKAVDLTDTERNIVILSFLGFRSKEEAELLHLSLHTVAKYRTNIRKKVGSDPISNLFK